jgi:uncharacterized protein (TIGR02453 family)
LTQSDGFVRLVDEANAFFAELAQNNRREWFLARKEHFDTVIARPASLFAEIMADDLSRISGTQLRPKVFRIYRDVRFSRDKSPYNAHLHMAWVPPEAIGPTPQWFFGTAPDYTVFLAGLPPQQGEGLRRLRAIVDRRGEAIAAAIAESGAELSDFGAAPLKRVPAPYPPDHPQGALLRRKSLIVGGALPDGWRDLGLRDALVAEASRLLPIVKLMREDG